MHINQEDVVQFLKAHPNFFVENADVFVDLKLPHDSGGAISLIERQVHVLRERNAQLQKRLLAFIEHARMNDVLFDKTKRLLLSLLEAEDMDELVVTLMQSLREDFCVEHAVFLLLTDSVVTEVTLSHAHARQVLREDAEAVLGTIVSNNQVVCGQLDDSACDFIFHDQAKAIQSVALTPISCGTTMAVVALGSQTQSTYQPQMDTLFLTYIAEILSRLLSRQ